MNVGQIATEAANIADVIAARKRILCTVFDADAKTRLALSHGLPPEAYYDLPFAAWLEIKRRSQP